MEIEEISVKIRPTSRNLFNEFSLSRFYFILILSSFYFLLEITVSHICHSLILQIDAYHMLYNIFSLLTCIITIKMCHKGGNVKNTFGWTRIDVCGAVANLCFLAALCFSVVTEAIQTMLHVSHHEKMHIPVLVGVTGVIGLAVNVITFYVIGGYTFHQSSFLNANAKMKAGDDIMTATSVKAYVQNGLKVRHRQNLLQTFRDGFGSVFVIICALVVYSWKHPLADFFDPMITILTVVILVTLSYRYAKEAGHILLLTIPDHINVANLIEELYKTFPEIVDIHELHVWQLTPQKVIASAHIVLRTTEGYLAIQNNIIHFLHTQGISHVTLQPEFVEVEAYQSEKNGIIKNPMEKCFIPCEFDDCKEKQCCTVNNSTSCNSSPSSLQKRSPAGSQTSKKVMHLNVDTNLTSDSHDVSDDDEPELKPMI